MTKTPVVLILHGDDAAGMARRVAKLAESVSEDPAAAEMNISRLDGKINSEEELRTAALALPFLAKRRLVILTNPLARVTTDAARKKFREFLDGLPEYTTLVLWFDDTFERGDWARLPVKRAHWLRKWAADTKQSVEVSTCQPPRGGAMVAWIVQEAKDRGGVIQQDAARALAELVGSDTGMAAQEIDKLLIAVNFERAVTLTDVQQLAFPGGQSDVFSLVDALATGDTPRALRMLHRLLEEQEPPILYAMIIRQFRLLLLVREMIAERGNSAQAAAELRISGYEADKLFSQAPRFSLSRLEAIYHRLLELDEAMKTSQITPELAMDTFVAEMSAARPA